ncbi:hypothetical protein EP7_005636 (plasmid) [Isosphaeraceae bacterium EP7]
MDLTKDEDGWPGSDASDAGGSMIRIAGTGRMRFYLLLSVSPEDEYTGTLLLFGPGLKLKRVVEIAKHALPGPEVPPEARWAVEVYRLRQSLKAVLTMFDAGPSARVSL